MAGPRTYSFEWDPAKARANLEKHGILFRIAASVLRDPLAVTIYDDNHSGQEERWVTIGQASTGQTLVVVHTFEWIGATDVKIRIVSARRATRQEIRNYEDVPR